MKKEPMAICINVDGLIIDHLLEKHKSDVCKLIDSEIYKKNVKSTDGQVITQACFSRCPDIPNQTEVFQRYYDQFMREEASVDLKDKSVRDLAAKLSITVHANPPDSLSVVIGRRQDIVKFLEHADRSSHIQNAIELPPEKIQLLLSTGYLQELQENFSVKIDAYQDKIIVTGPEHRIDRVETKLNLRLQNITTSNLQITSSMCDFLIHPDTCDYIRKDFQRYKIYFTVDEVSRSVILFAMSQKDLSKGMETFKKEVVEIGVPLDDKQSNFMKSEKGLQFLEKLSSSKFLKVHKSDNQITFTGLHDECHGAEEELIEVLEENAFLRRFLTFSIGRTKAMFTIFKERIDMMLQEKRYYQFSIKKSSDECSIEVTGYGKDVNAFASEIKALAKELRKEELVFQRPGLSKVIELDSCKHLISGIERDKKVIIIRKEEDKQGSIPREELEKEYDIILDKESSTLICAYQKNDGLTLSVLRGDITKHKADIIVNPANKNLLHGGGVAGAIVSAGGIAIQDECSKFIRDNGSLFEGEVATTNAGSLPCRRIIHAVGPQWPSNTRIIGEQELQQNKAMSKNALAEAMKNVLKEAEKEECRILAVPAISSGIFGFPKDLCAQILIKATMDMSRENPFHSLKEVHFVSNDDQTVQAFSNEFISSFGMDPKFKAYYNVKNLKKKGDEPVKPRVHGGRKDKASGKYKQRYNTTEKPLGTKMKVAISNGIEIELIIDDLAKVTVSLYIIFIPRITFLP